MSSHSDPDEIQELTMRSWCNYHLCQAKKTPMVNLGTDFKTGVPLINLLEVLSGRELQAPFPYPNGPGHYQENMEYARFHMRKLGIVVSHIDEFLVVKDASVRKYVRLIWSLIVFFQISAAVPLKPGVKFKRKPTPRLLLLAWVQRKLEGKRKVSNFTTDWRDGLALAALVDAISPFLMPFWVVRDPSYSVRNAIDAMKVAGRWLSVPRILQPHHMVSDNCDQLSLMTYISYFPLAKLRVSAPLMYPKNTQSTYLPDALKKMLLRPGKEDCPLFIRICEVMEKAVARTSSAERRRRARVEAGKETAADKRKAEAALARIMSRRHLSSQQSHTTGGRYRSLAAHSKRTTHLHQRAAGLKQARASGGNRHGPSKKGVEKQNTAPVCDATKLIVTGNITGRKRCILARNGTATFSVDAKNAGSGQLSANVYCGSEHCEIELTCTDEHIYEGGFVAADYGEYVLSLKWNGVDIPGSPFTIISSMHELDFAKVFVEGPVVENTYHVVGKPAIFRVTDHNFTKQPLQVLVNGPGGKPVDVEIDTDGSHIKGMQNGVHNCRFRPEHRGPHTVSVALGGYVLPSSPLTLYALYLTDAGSCVAGGDGLQPFRGHVNEQATITVDTGRAGTGNLDVSVKSPSDVELNLVGSFDETEDLATMYYTPRLPGLYTVTIEFAGQHVKGSPFPVNVIDRKLVKVSLPDAATKFHRLWVDKPFEVSVDTTKAGPGRLRLIAQSKLMDDAPLALLGEHVLSAAQHEITYSLDLIGSYRLDFDYSHNVVPGNSFDVQIIDPRKVRVHGAGLQEGNVVGHACPFTVEFAEAGDAPVVALVSGPAKTQLRTTLVQGQRLECVYFPTVAGDYTVRVLCDGEDVSCSPVLVQVGEFRDATKCTVTGPGVHPATGLLARLRTVFDVDVSQCGCGSLEVMVSHTTDGGPVQCSVQCDDSMPGVSHCSYEPLLGGRHKVSIKFAGRHVPGSPFYTDVKWPKDSERVTVLSEDFPRALTLGEAVTLQAMCKEAGDGKLRFEVQPSEQDHRTREILPELEQTQDGGRRSFQFVPNVVSDHLLHVTYDSSPVCAAPFKLHVEPRTPRNIIHAEGAGLQPQGVQTGLPAEFTIRNVSDTTRLTVRVETPSHGPYNLQITPASSRAAKQDLVVLNAGYLPSMVGQHTVHILYAGQHIRQSPFQVSIGNASKCIIVGPSVSNDSVAHVGKLVEYTVLVPVAAGPGSTAIIVRDPHDNDLHLPAESQQERTGEMVCRVRFQPQEVGVYEVNATHCGGLVPRAPFSLKCIDLSLVEVSGSCLEGVLVGSRLIVNVNSQAAGPGQLTWSLDDTQLHVQHDQPAPGLHKLSFVATAVGERRLTLKFAGCELPCSPICLPVYDLTKVKLRDPYLKENDEEFHIVFINEVINIPIDLRTAAPITSIATGKMETPSGNLVDGFVSANLLGINQMKFTPTEVGVHRIELEFFGVVFPNMPLTFACVDPSVAEFEPDQLDHVIVDIPTSIVLNASRCYDGCEPKLESYVTERNHNLKYCDVDVETITSRPGQFRLTFTPTQPGRGKLRADLFGCPVSGSPMVFSICDPALCTMEGSGLGPTVRVGKPLSFTVDCKRAGMGALTAVIHNARTHEQLEAVVSQTYRRGTFDVSYQLSSLGTYRVAVGLAGQRIPDSPFTIIAIDPSQVSIRGRMLKVVNVMDEEVSFTVDASQAGDTAQLSAELVEPIQDEILLEEQEQGVYIARFTPHQPEMHIVNVYLAGFLVPESPIQISVTELYIG
ncbi:filamin-A-like [Sycon ciliatum]|uniref:filamin-A-like n=1 Tax=Sycon ciliatum TaxID=27933 RepID=UPI0031F6B66E